MSFTWAKGRQLQGIAKDGLNASYTYDENGLRLSKNVNGVTTKIFRTNGQMVGMNMSDGKDMTFILDGDGKVYGVHYDHYSFDQKKTETYYFAFNAQGDVIGIYEFYGKVIATYDYDEWGNCTVNVLCEDNNGHAVDSPDHIAYANPFRYRSYFYDAETGFYYLNSRYYDPGTGRFINADEYYNTQTGILSHNMFAYCNNNPINMLDENGKLGSIASKLWGWLATVVAVLGAVTGGLGAAVAGLAGLVAIGAAVDIGGSIYENSKSRSAEKALTKTAKKYGKFQCKEAADAMEKELRKRKLHGEVIELYFPNAYQGYVISDRNPNEAISTNGRHYGVLYQGKVYCNIYPEGKDELEWIESFHADDETGKQVNRVKF